MSNPRDPFAAGPVPNSSSGDTITIPIEHPTLIDGTPIKPERQVIIDTNPYRDQMPTELMRRPGYGKLGDKVRLKLNSHYIEQISAGKGVFYQYDVSHFEFATPLQYFLRKGIC